MSTHGSESLRPRTATLPQQRDGDEAMTSPTDNTGDPGRRRLLLGRLPLGHWHGVDVDAHWSVFVTLGLFVT